MVRTYWLDPFDEIRNLEDRMDRMFREVFEAPAQNERRLLPGRIKEGLVKASEPYIGPMRTALPHLDILDRENSIKIKADIPGVKKEDVDINIKKGLLEISAERKDEKEENEDDYIRRERTYSKYYRSISLPEEIDAEKTEAKFTDGVLELTIPKTEVEEVKKIKVE
ncbi:MAG: Hsp20/alpha crystallin family protein [Halobacteriota archaeon]|nr:Hsp20/alpha crystallin family protein [Halobacteriota archaeon]